MRELVFPTRCSGSLRSWCSCTPAIWETLFYNLPKCFLLWQNCHTQNGNSLPEIYLYSIVAYIAKCRGENTILCVAAEARARVNGWKSGECRFSSWVQQLPNKTQPMMERVASKELFFLFSGNMQAKIRWHLPGFLTENAHGSLGRSQMDITIQHLAPSTSPQIIEQLFNLS